MITIEGENLKKPMNLKRNIQYSVRFKAVSEGAVWVVYAFGIERDGNRVVRTFAPRIVQIIPKNTPALAGEVSTAESEVLLLDGARISAIANTSAGTPSPYFNLFVAFQNVLVTLRGPRPPTFAY